MKHLIDEVPVSLVYFWTHNSLGDLDLMRLALRFVWSIHKSFSPHEVIFWKVGPAACRPSALHEFLKISLMHPLPLNVKAGVQMYSKQSQVKEPHTQTRIMPVSNDLHSGSQDEWLLWRPCTSSRRGQIANVHNRPLVSTTWRRIQKKDP